MEYIKRCEKTSNFTMIHNNVFKSGLTPEAIGVLCIILHLPSNWVFRKSWMIEHYGISRRHLDDCFKQFVEKGYVCELDLVRTQDGEFSGKGYIFYDYPYNDESFTIGEAVPKAKLAKPAKLRTDPLEDIQFETFMQNYPISHNKAKAKQEFFKLNLTERQLVLERGKQYNEIASTWSEDDKQWIKHPHKFISDRKFEEDPKDWVRTKFIKPGSPRPVFQIDADAYKEGFK